MKIGVLVPAGNMIHEHEFNLLQPRGVEFRFAGFSYPTADSTDFCNDLNAQMREPMTDLKAWGAEAMLVGCTAASMRCAGDQHRANLEKIAGVPVVTAAAAVAEAVAAMGITSMAIATPYGAKSNGIVADFVTSLGVKVAAIAGLNLDRDMTVWKTQAVTLTPQQVFDFGKTVDTPAASAMYLPCTGIASLETLDWFEKKNGKPAISSVQAGYWAVLRRVGVDGRRSGFGRLIETWNF